MPKCIRCGCECLTANACSKCEEEMRAEAAERAADEWAREEAEIDQRYWDLRCEEAEREATHD